MQKIHLNHVRLPNEFISLLKMKVTITNSPSPIFDIIKPNKAIYCILEKAFKEFDDGKGLEKTMMALGWANFRDRMASLYIYKLIYGSFPKVTSMDLVEEIKQIEIRFASHGVHSHSRAFLLGFYLKMSNIDSQLRDHNKFIEIKIPEELGNFLKFSFGRSEKIDWLILIIMLFLNGLGEKMLMNALIAGKKFDEIYQLLSPEFRENMIQNLLAYGASIGEQDIFLYEKI